MNEQHYITIAKKICDCLNDNKYTCNVKNISKKYTLLKKIFKVINQNNLTEDFARYVNNTPVAEYYKYGKLIYTTNIKFDEEKYNLLECYIKHIIMMLNTDTIIYIHRYYIKHVLKFITLMMDNNLCIIDNKINKKIIDSIETHYIREKDFDNYNRVYLDIIKILSVTTSTKTAEKILCKLQMDKML